jgi:hypothetical protein
MAGIHPLNYQDGELLPSAFDNRKLRKMDISVCRRERSSWNEFKTAVIDAVINKGNALNPPQIRTCEKVFVARCDEVRQIIVEGANIGAFCVVDDGLDGFPSHAVVGFSDPIRNDGTFWIKLHRMIGKSIQTAVIANLTETFNRGATLPEECFAGMEDKPT